MDNLTAVESIFLAALEKNGPEERAAFLNEACNADKELRRSVERLLAAQPRVGEFLQSPPPGLESRTEDDPAVDNPGRRLGPYRLLQQIGEGGMGVVWMAEQEQPVRRKVALKVIKPGMDSKQVLARFEAERQALALMDHQNIARVLDAGTTSQDRPYFVMELVHGVPITRFCDDNKLTTRERLELFVPVCQAIQHAHQKGIIHRDIKPSNILVTMYDDKPVPKVIDFGVAKAIEQRLTERTLFTQFGTLVGTFEYMSPEQAEMNALGVDTRSDIYSLGVLLYELLTGTTPLEHNRFKEAALDEMVRLIREEEPPRPSARLSSSDTLPKLAALRRTEPARLAKLMRGELDWIVLKCLEKDRARRYETANGLARDIERHLRDEAVEACPPSAGYRVQKFLRRHWAGALTASAFAVLLLAGVAVSVWLAWLARQAEAEAHKKEAQALEAAAQEKQASAAAVAAAVAEGEAKKAAQLAAAAEETAKNVAQARLGQIEKVNDVLAAIFKDLNPYSEEKNGPGLREQLNQKLEKAAAELDAVAIHDPLALARLQHTLGTTLVRLDRPRAGLALLEKAYPVLETRFGPDNLLTLNAMSDLAAACRTTGQPDRAVRLYEQVLDRRRRLKGPDDPETLTAMNNLGLTYLAVGRQKESLELLRKVLDKEQMVLGPTAPVTLATMHNVGTACNEAGQPEEAILWLQKALAGRQELFGPNHFATLNTMTCLGAAFQHNRQPDQAIALLEQSLPKLQEKVGPDHWSTRNAMLHLGAAYRDKQQPKKALPLLVQGLKGTKERFGPDHARTQEQALVVMQLYHSLGQFDKALPMHEERYRRALKTWGEKHIDTLIAMRDLAEIYSRLKRFEEAEPLFRKSLDGMKDKPADAPVVLSAESALVNMYYAAGKPEGAESVLRNRLALLRRKADPESLIAATVMSGLGLNFLKQKRFAEAEPLLRDSLVIYEKVKTPDWTMAHVRSLLGAALLGQKKYAEAEPLLREAYQVLKQNVATMPPPMRGSVTDAIHWLVELHDATGQSAQADTWRQRLAEAPTTSKEVP